MIKVEDLTYKIEGKSIIEKINFHVKNKVFLGIVGPNGSGKSTLLKNIYKSISGTGVVLIQGDSIYDINNKNLAKKMSVVKQESDNISNLKVEEIVIMGRYPYKKFYEGYSNQDYNRVKKSLKKVGLEGFEKREFSSLSGGEKQRVLVSRALTQDAEIIVLDEPTNHLDIRYQLEIMNLLKSLDLTIVTSIHDMNIASYYCDRLVAIKEGKVYREGTPKEVFNNNFFRDMFDVDVDIVENKKTKALTFTYIPK